MNATHPTLQQNRLEQPFFIWRRDDEAHRTFCGVVYAMGPWGAVTAAQERFGGMVHYEARVSKNGGRVATTW
jgi:hypothetical protein